MHTRIVTLTLAMATAVAHGQTSDQQQLQQTQMLQLLLQMQQQQQQLQSQTASRAVPPANLSPEQLQRLVQALSLAQGQGSATNADMIKALMAAQAPGAAAQASQVVPSFLIRQGDQQTTATPLMRATVFVKTKSNDVADALKAQALSQGIHIGAAAAARKLAPMVPYFGGMYSVMAGANMFGGGPVKGFEFDFLHGLSAPFELKAAAFEIQLPPTVAIETAWAPLLVRLRLHEQDKVRIIAARKIQLTRAKPNAFGALNQEPFEREVVSVDFESFPVIVEKAADGSTVVRRSQALPSGEYALVLQRPEPKVFRLLDHVLDFRVGN